MKTKRTINELEASYKNLALLEALNAFYQIKGLVVAESSEQSDSIEEVLLELHKRFFVLIREHFQEDDWKIEKFLKLLLRLDEDIYRIIHNSNLILAATLDIKNLLLKIKETPQKYECIEKTKAIHLLCLPK